MMAYLAPPFQNRADFSLAQQFQVIKEFIEIVGSVLDERVILVPLFLRHCDLVVLGEDEKWVLGLYQFSQGHFLVEMHGGVVLIPSSFSSVLKQLIDTGDLSSHLFLKMIGFSILENELGIKEFLIDEAWV